MARIIGVVSGKGGVGKTTVVSNLSYSLRALGYNVIAIDCNITTPHLSHHVPSFNWHATLNDVIRGRTSIFSALHYNNGIYVVPSSPDLNDLIDLDISSLRNIVQQLGNTESFVILDSAPGLGKEALSVLESCNEIIFVTTPQKVAVDDILRCKKVVQEMRVKQLGVILNMSNKRKYNLTMKEIEEITGLNVIGNIFFDEKIIDSISKKSPIVKFQPYTESSDEFMKIASTILGIPYRRQGKISRMLARLFKMKYKPKIHDYGLLMYATDNNLRTTGDKILDLLASHKELKIGELVEKTNLSEQEIYKWGRILYEHKLINMKPSILGIKNIKLIWND